MLNNVSATLTIVLLAGLGFAFLDGRMEFMQWDKTYISWVILGLLWLPGQIFATLNKWNNVIWFARTATYTGLIGTLVGFILMIIPFIEYGEITKDALLEGMTGLSTAFITSLVGSVVYVILEAQEYWLNEDEV